MVYLLLVAYLSSHFPAYLKCISWQPQPCCNAVAIYVAWWVQGVTDPGCWLPCLLMLVYVLLAFPQLNVMFE